MKMKFKTPKGTEILISDIKGKPYMQVQQRLLWFREEHPDWSILTEKIEGDKESCLFQAKIIHAGAILSTGHKREHKAHFQDFEEKAETGAIGRALANCGYGTQFAPELLEGDRIVDSPINKEHPIDVAAQYFEPLPSDSDLAFEQLFDQPSMSQMGLSKQTLPDIQKYPDEVMQYGIHKGKTFSEMLSNKGYLLWANDQIRKRGISKINEQLKKLVDFAKEHKVI
jgi:hypothetical protein